MVITSIPQWTRRIKNPYISLFLLKPFLLVISAWYSSSPLLFAFSSGRSRTSHRPWAVPPSSLGPVPPSVPGLIYLLELPQHRVYLGPDRRGRVHGSTHCSASLSVSMRHQTGNKFLSRILKENRVMLMWHYCPNNNLTFTWTKNIYFISCLGPIHRKHSVSLTSEIQFTIVRVSVHKVLNTKKMSSCGQIINMLYVTSSRIMLRLWILDSWLQILIHPLFGPNLLMLWTILRMLWTSDWQDFWQVWTQLTLIN
jgi:hypothetical protein